jgi:hypothetical protein
VTERLTPERLVEIVKRRGSACPDAIVAYWYHVDDRDDRHVFRARADELGRDAGIVPLVIRAGFDNANSILSDLNELVATNKEAFAAAAGTSKIIILLLGRTALEIAQQSSPITLPQWFPIRGGEVVYVKIEDLTRTADEFLNCPEARIDDLCELLHRLDVAVVGRLAGVHAKDHNAINGFWDRVKDEKDPEDKVPRFLDKAQEYLQRLKDPKSFRPSAKDDAKHSFTGRVLRLFSRVSPDAFDSTSTALVKALALADVTIDESLVAVLLRPTNPPKGAARFGRNVLVTVFASSQFVTGAAHADAYPPFPVSLLAGASYDLRKALTRMIEVIEAP